MSNWMLIGAKSGRVLSHVAILGTVFASLTVGSAFAHPESKTTVSMPRFLPRSFPTSFYKKRGLLPVSADGQFTSDTTSRKPASSLETPGTNLTFSSAGTQTVDLTSTPPFKNSRIIIRNTGNVDIRNPWVIANNTRDWFDSASIAREAVGAESDPELRAFRVWDFVLRNRYHWHPAEEGMEIHSPVKFLNVYGYGFCDDSAATVEALWKLAGFAKARSCSIIAHVVPEVFYNDDWHMFDADKEFFYPGRDNKEVASVARIAADPSLADRISPELIPLFKESKKHVYGSGRWDTTSTMAMVLRPGESLERCHYNWGKFHDNYHRMEPPLYGNGKQSWRPDLASTLTSGKGFSLVENITWNDGARPTTSTRAASLQARMHSSYVFVGGNVSAQIELPTASDSLQIQCRKAGRAWISAGLVKGPFSGPIAVPLDKIIATTSSPACYDFEVRVLMPASPNSSGSMLRDLDITGEIQCAPWSLPTLIPGNVNQISVAFFHQSDARLDVQFDSFESPEGFIPSPPSSPIFPAHDSTVSPDTLEFAWNSQLPDDPNVWREIVISWDPDGIHPVSPQTLHRGRIPNRWSPPPGWLTPGNSYYWRVREFHEKSEWSSTWNFKVEDSLPNL